MRHRASRPFIDLWRRFPRAGARLIGEVARPGPVRAMLAVLLVASLGTGAYVAVAAVMGGSSDQQAGSTGIDPLGPTDSSDGEGSGSTPDLLTSDDRTPSASSPEAGGSTKKQSEESSPATGVTPSERSTLEATGSPSTGNTTPSTTDPPTPSGTPSRTPSGTSSSSPSPPSASPSKDPQDRTPPTTSLSEEYPAGDAARFSFSANESGSFACSLDGADYTTCVSPVSYSDVHSGWHTFAVRAIDEAGNVDPSPAEARWHAEGSSADD